MSELSLPTRDQTEAVYVIFDLESFRRPETRREDRAAAHEVVHRFIRAAFPDRDPHADGPHYDPFYCGVNDVAAESEYDSSWEVYADKMAGMLTLEQWLRVADDLCMDLDEDAVVPDDAEQTLGSLTGEHGWIPAVSIPHLDEGWGSSRHEPALMISCYVSILVKDGSDTVNALPCGCVPHEIIVTDRCACYCVTEGQPYCNFECPHEDEDA